MSTTNSMSATAALLVLLIIVQQTTGKENNSNRYYSGDVLWLGGNNTRCLCSSPITRQEDDGKKLWKLSPVDKTSGQWQEVERCSDVFCSGLRDNPTPKSTFSTVEKYGYGTLAVFLISLCSVAGVLLVPLTRFDIYKHVATGFVAFGLGIMVGDALLHLIPEVLHVSEDDTQPFWQSLIIMVTVYGLFTFETIMELLHHRGDQAPHRCPRRHSHSHIPFPEDIILHRDGLMKPSAIPSCSLEGSGMVRQTPPPPADDGHWHSPQRYTGLPTLALVIIVGDTVHNLGDGLAVGAAMASGPRSGLATSLAVFCHELPHEFGDFVMLMSTGLSFRQALVANLASALTAFVGLYIGISIGASVQVRHWIFAFTAGMFLYIAIGDMLPELRNHNHNVGVFLSQNVGMAAGMGLMILMAAAENGVLIG